MKLLSLVGISVFGTVLSAQNMLSPGTGLAMSATNGTASFAKPTIAHVVDDKHANHMKILWLSSIVAMTAATALDSASSWNKKESNGFLASSNGTFGAKGVSIKAAIAGGVLVPQFLFRKHADWYGAFAVGNFAEAGIFTGAAIHNYRVKAPAN